MRVTWAEILRAAALVGVPGWKERLQFGRLGAYEAWRRVLHVVTHLEPTATHTGTGVFQTDLFASEDPSEKTGSSYLIGMTLALVLARAAGDADALLHFDSVHGSLGKRPDLVDALRRDSHFFEAKGRAGTAPQKTMDDAVLQLAQHRLSSQTVYAAATVAGFRNGRLEGYRQRYKKVSPGAAIGVTGPRPDPDMDPFSPLALAVWHAALMEPANCGWTGRTGYAMARNSESGLILGLRVDRLLEVTHSLSADWVDQDEGLARLAEGEVQAQDFEADEDVLVGWDHSVELTEFVDLETFE